MMARLLVLVASASALRPIVTRRAVLGATAAPMALVVAPHFARAADDGLGIGGLLPLVELRASLAETAKDVETREFAGARRRLLKLIAARELFRTVVAQNAQRSLAEDGGDAKMARAKGELRVLRTADRVVAKITRAELCLSQGRTPELVDEARAALDAAAASLGALLDAAPPGDVARAERLLVALRRADDGDGVLSDDELAALPAEQRRDAYDAQGAIALAAELAGKGDSLRRMSTGARLFIGM